MSAKNPKQKPVEKIWSDFQEEEKLSERQLEQFQKYATHLMQRNQEFNLTAITELTGVVRQHFHDSLALRKFVDLSVIKKLCDIGTGAGFPAIPLKILYPHLNILLIEVTQKKQLFLREVIALLELENVDIYELDWRTFVRTTELDVDLFVTRAALDEAELSRAFRSNCVYKDVPIVYWVATDWQPEPKFADLVTRIESYKLGHKQRKLAFLGSKKVSE
jgi:16S rRNA (guanine(527)-N(7))-methyltransferase RsmG